MRFRPWAGGVALMLSISGVTALVGITPAAAATLTVTNCNNSGAGSLRQTITNASSGDTINFALSPACSTIDDPTGTILITKNLTIKGPGASALAVSGDTASGIFYVNSGVTASISGITIEKTAVSSGGAVDNNGTLTVSSSRLSGNSAASNGGGIYNNGTLIVTNSTLSGNSANNGGAIYNAAGAVTVTNSTLSGNSLSGTSEQGGGIFNNGTLTISGSTISGNSLSGSYSNNGGGIYNAAGTATVTNSTISGNTITGGNTYNYGGGILNNATLTVTNSTLSDNYGEFGGGGISNSGTTNIINSTLSGNIAGYGGGLRNGAGTVTVANSTLSGNTSGDGPGGAIWGAIDVQATVIGHNTGTDCANGVIDKGYNIDDDGSCGFTGSSISDYATLRLTFGPLANNGGLTQTIALLPASPAIDYVPAVDCPAADQRGFARTAPCDIGAYDTDNGSVVSRSGLHIITTSLPNGTPGSTYPTTTLAATGGNPPYTWRLAKGSAKLPKGLKLNKHTGVISGTPKNTAKSSTFTVEVLDSKIKVKHHHATQNTATKMLSITIS